jgi:hypothetical protein
MMHTCLFHGTSKFPRQCVVCVLAVNLFALFNDDRSRDNSVGTLTTQEQEVYVSCTASRPALAHTHPTQCVLVAFPRWWSSRNVRLFSFLHIVPRLKRAELYPYSSDIGGTSDYVALYGRDDEWIMIWKKSACGQSLCTCWKCLEGLRNALINPVWIAVDLAETCNGHLSNTSQKCYCFSQVAWCMAVKDRRMSDWWVYFNRRLKFTVDTGLCKI